MSLCDLHCIFVYDAEYMMGDCPLDDTIFVYNPEGCEHVIVPGDRVTCHNPVILSSIKICDVVELHKEQISRVFIEDIENIKEPIYFISPNISRHFGLDVDGDYLYIQKEEKII